MGRGSIQPLLILSALLLLLSSSKLVLAEIKTLTLTSDSRPLILFEKFGFTLTGHITVSVSSVSYSSSLTTPALPSLLGFFLLSQESLKVLREPNWCILSSRSILPLFNFQDLTLQGAFNYSYPVYSPNECSLFFANCAPDCSVSMHVRTEMYNLDPSSGDKDFLPAGQTQLPFLYLSFFLAYLVFLGIWVSVCLYNRYAVHCIQILLAALLLAKALNIFCASANQKYIKLTGTPHGFDILFYIFQFIRVILLFTVIILIGAGWSFLKPFLQEREKKVLIIMIPLQVLANAISFVIGTGPSIQHWVILNWAFILIDAVCCCTIILPIIWSIGVLGTNMKAARNLAKLTMFRHLYTVVVGYLFFTRIVVVLFGTITSYNYQWVTCAAKEGATLVFFMIIFYMFRPVENNEYFVCNS